MHDVTQYNLIERGEYSKPKYRTRQKERNIYCYVESTGQVIINAEFSNGKSMWVSTGTRAGDLEENTAVFELILKTMEEEPSVWYAADFVSVRTSIKLGADRLAKACILDAYFREDKFMDFAGVWAEYSKDTPRKLAMQLFGMFSDSCSEPVGELARLMEIKKKLDSFSTEGNWQYNYGKISPCMEELKKLRYLKINSNISVRNLYIELEKTAGHLYNEYQSRVR